MYKKAEQIVAESDKFELPFGGKLAEDNRWVIMLKGWQAPLRQLLGIDCSSWDREHNSRSYGDLSWYIEKLIEK